MDSKSTNSGALLGLVRDMAKTHKLYDLTWIPLIETQWATFENMRDTAGVMKSCKVQMLVLT